jgi:hypothetical protein
MDCDVAIDGGSTDCKNIHITEKMTVKAKQFHFHMNENVFIKLLICLSIGM